ncbi:MAG: magnesium transporter [Christensenellaceae bacterium]|jgi:magnesium transporter|nr:magnesium transporter [Christensenellaceae bacterium]
MEHFEELGALLQGNRLPELRSALREMNAVDIAAFMEDLPKERALLVFRLLPKDLCADVFSYMEDTAQQLMIVESISDREVRAVIEDLFLDDAVDFLEEMPANVVKRVLRSVDKGTREQISEFLKYPQDSAASLMTVEFVELHDHYTVREAFARLRATAVDKETVDLLYAIDRTHHLTGFISLYKLVTSPEDALLSDCMERNVLAVNAFDDKELVAQTFTRYDLSAMPVVDNEGRLVGLITVDDVVDVIQEENTEDIQIMAATTPNDKPYLQTGVLSLSKDRVLWLLILMISATVTGSIITSFEGVLQSSVALAAFIPMLMDTGGNAGAQSSTLIIRGIALGEIRIGDMLRVLWKEFRISILVGLALAAVNFGRILLFTSSGAMVSLTVSLSVFLTVIVAKTIGGLLPIVAKLCRLDPAVMASPLITTIVDAIALIVYFLFAVNLLHIAA